MAPAVLALRPGRFLSADPELHLLRRATYGITPEARRRIERLGAEGWLEEQLDPTSIADDACEELIAERFPRLSWSIREAHQRLDFDWDLMFDLGVATLARACWSERQLLEVMVDFWSNHLHVTSPSDAVWDCRHDYDRAVIRAHALGRFSDMLAASAMHPAMLRYLNNDESTRSSPNENYGRELLELHTVGVDGGYDERDMRSSALVMTGFGVDERTGEFAYHPEHHYTGPVRVMGWSSPNRDRNGLRVGLGYLAYLARHPSTALHLATKLCRRFVTDSPPRALVERLAEVYLDHDTEIRPVLRELFASAAFAAAVGAKVRRPMEDVVATIRTLGIRPDRQGNDGMYGLYWMLWDMGNAPFAWHPPNGYPDVAEAWRSAGGAIARWNAHQSLASHWWPRQLVRPPLRRLLSGPTPETLGDLVQALAERVVHTRLAPRHRDTVCAFLGRSPGSPLEPDDEALGWRLPYLVALLLDSPYHELR
jgi:uncharacterized protein (DUF1800 family)